MDRAAEATCRLGCQIGSQWRNRFVVVARIVGELHGDWIVRALRNGTIQFLDRPLGFDALVEPYETDPLRQACQCVSNETINFLFILILILLLLLLFLFILSTISRRRNAFGDLERNVRAINCFKGEFKFEVSARER